MTKELQERSASHCAIAAPSRMRVYEGLLDPLSQFAVAFLVTSSNLVKKCVIQLNQTITLPPLSTETHLPVSELTV